MSQKIFEIFSVSETKTIFHKLDPRTKGIIIIFLSTLSFIYNDLGLQILLFFTIFPLVLISKTTKQIWEGIKGLKIIILLILLINTYFLSLNQALITIFRIINLLVAISIYFQTTSPDDLMQSMMAMHFPYSIAFAFSLSFRFIPTFTLELITIQDAQKSRGHQIEEGNILQKIRNWFPILIPLLLNSIYRAFHVAEALETRGFGISKTITSYYPLKFHKKDFFSLLVALGIVSVGILLKTNSALFPSIFYWNLVM